MESMSKPISILHRTIMKAVKKPIENSTITNYPRADLAAPENEIYSVVYPEEFNPSITYSATCSSCLGPPIRAMSHI